VHCPCLRKVPSVVDVRCNSITLIALYKYLVDSSSRSIESMPPFGCSTVRAYSLSRPRSHARALSQAVWSQGFELEIAAAGAARQERRYVYAYSLQVGTDCVSFGG
jgi:hypothetical protein